MTGERLMFDNAKLGLGPAGGGAVRLGGIGKKIGLAEGVESALGAWNLIGRRYPVWAALSTSGLIGIEIPLGVEEVIDFPRRRRAHAAQGARVQHRHSGRAQSGAASAGEPRLPRASNARLATEPGPGRDYNDLWLEAMREGA
jgi:hypothetical protein